MGGALDRRSARSANPRASCIAEMDPGFSDGARATHGAAAPQRWPRSERQQRARLVQPPVRYPRDEPLVRHGASSGFTYEAPRASPECLPVWGAVAG